MSVAVIGQGFVGGSLTSVLAERNEKVFVFDKAGTVATGGNYKFIESNGDEFLPKSIQDFVQKCEQQKEFSGIYFVCVPTPMMPDGRADTRIVESVLSEISRTPFNFDSPERIAVIKSTVPPGSTEKWNETYGCRGLHVIFCPEFLTEANALNDMREQTRIVLGGPRPWINAVKMIFQRSFPKVAIVKTSSTTAEVIKYMTNCFLAVKVSFANEVSQICEGLDSRGLNVDYDKVVEYAKMDARLGSSHWSVPGSVPIDSGRFVRGWGGHCFPKDINAFMNVANEVGVKPTVMMAAWEKNLEVRGPQDRDWEKQIGRAVSEEE
jgi:UDPglucose 6-dehydrogenase